MVPGRPSVEVLRNVIPHVSGNTCVCMSPIGASSTPNSLQDTRFWPVAKFLVDVP